MSSLLVRYALAGSMLLATATALGEWREIKVDEALLVMLFGEENVSTAEGRAAFRLAGTERIPGCSTGPSPFISETGELLSASPTAGSGDFSFFVDKDGDARGLLLYLAGGGACWDATTCVGSALTTSPIYYGAVTETAAFLDAFSADADGSGAGGILTRRPDNPHADFIKVYIPYCTGDIHIGSRDTDYSYVLPATLGGATLDWRVHHRGFDNLLVVLQWIQHEQLSEAGGKVTVAGSSAGGYGALINFPVIRDALGEGQDYSIIIDSSNGVLTNGFLDQTFGVSSSDPGVWGARQNIDEILQPALNRDASTLWSEVFKAIGRAYPDTRVSQSTAAYDLAQTFVYWTMQAVDQGTFDPLSPPTELEILFTGLLDWSPKARLAMISTALKTPNYRYYLGAGQGHIHLIDPPPAAFPFPTTNYFAERSGGRVYYTKWLTDMLYNPRRLIGTDWRNLTCFPNCLE